MDQNNILIKPIITEKSMREASLGCFTFMVSLHARKPQIQKAVEENFNVNVIDVKTIVAKGKKKRVGKRRAILQLAPWKKAIVRLSTGQKIDLFEGETNEKKT